MARIANNAHMLREILEEASLFQDILNRREHYTEEFVHLACSRPLTRLIFLGSGSPSHACKTLKYAANELLGVRADAVIPSLFLNHEGMADPCGHPPDSTVLICPVESGRTKGPVYAARQARSLGIPVVSTTINPDSSLAELSDIIIVKPSGPEIAPPSTKGHSTGILLVLLCLLDAAKALGRIRESKYDQYLLALEKLAERVPHIVAYTRSWFERHREAVLASEHYWFIAYGANVGTAEESVLKFIESHQKPTFAYDLEEFLHGPLCAVRPNDVVFFLAAEEGAEKRRMYELYRAMKPDFPHCTLVHDSKLTQSDQGDLHLPGEGLPFVNALEYLIPFQVLSYEIADAKGIDVTVWTTQKIRNRLKPGFDR